MRRTLFSILMLCCMAVTASGQVLLNELMQSNVDCVMDNLNQFPDSWVEIYNAGTTSASLGEYKLGATRHEWEAWQMPSATLAPGERRLIYCDTEASGWHASFRLESGNGCAVYLYHNAQIVDSVSGLPKQPSPNIAYGRQTDGAATWGYQITPTPNAANCGQISSLILGAPVFSIPGQVFEEEQVVSLTLSLPDNAPAGTVIRYTHDGSEPTAESPVFSETIYFNSSRTIRARLFCEGYLSPRSTAQSYIILGRDMTLPVISISTDDQYLNDPMIGIYVDGSYSGTDTKNYQYNWRRPMTFELFEESGTPSVLNQLIEGRMVGGASRGCPLKSMALYANKRFGHKRFDYEFFPDQRPGITDYKSIMLRNSGNDFDYLYLRDALIQRSMAQNVDLDWQAWQPAIIYINGTYRGILNIRERSNEHNIYSNYGGLEDICMVENSGELKTGQWSTWQQFVDFRSEHGHTWAEYEEQMDCVEYINLMLLHLFYNNQDFPGNNCVFWRPMQATDSLPARWRFIAKDTDFGLGLYDSPASYNTIAWLHNPDYDADRAWANGYDATRMFRRAMENDDFRREFLERAAVYMGDFLNYARVWEIWRPMRDMIAYEYPYHRKLFNEWWPNYSNEQTKAAAWLQQRPAQFISQLSSHYGLGATAQLGINQSLSTAECERIRVDMNGIRLTRSAFIGNYWRSRTIALHGENVLGWQVSITTPSGVTQQTINGADCTLSMPDACTVMVVNAMPGASAFDLPEQDDTVSKIFEQGRLVIIKNGHKYDALGRLLQ